MAFYAFLKTYNKHLIKNDQQRIELMSDLDEVFFNTKLTIGKKICQFLKLRAFHEELLDELFDFFYFDSFIFVLGIITTKKMKFLSNFQQKLLFNYLKENFLSIYLDPDNGFQKNAQFSTGSTVFFLT